MGYISGIFLFTDSSVVSDLATFNPYSLLHVPLYGILGLLLFFSVAPTELNHERQTKWMVKLADNKGMKWRTYFLMSDGIAFAVAIADEYSQSFIPSRTASIGDVLLDLGGIVLFLFLISRFKRIVTV